MIYLCYQINFHKNVLKRIKKILEKIDQIQEYELLFAKLNISDNLF